MLTVEDVARHFALSTGTVRKRIRSGTLPAARVNRTYRLAWPDVWSQEAGPFPRGARQARYKQPLMTKKQLAARTGMSVRTVERWIADGLPVRPVFGAVRINPADAAEWLKMRFGLELALEAGE